MYEKINRSLRKLFETKHVSHVRLLFDLHPYVTIWKFFDRTAETFLDVGCGKGNPLNHLTTISKGNVSRMYKVGVDLHLSYLKSAKSRRLYDDLILADVRHLPLKSKSFEIVQSLDVIEHLEKDQGMVLLDEVERIARKQVFILTPVGFLNQEGFDTPLQIHRSSWNPSDFYNRDYKVKGIDGFYFLRGEEGNSRFKGFLSIFSLILSHASQILVYLFPTKAFLMLCVNNIEGTVFTTKTNLYTSCTNNENSGNRTITIVDLDFTLVNTNTTFGFLENFNPKKYYLLSRILKPVIILNKYFKQDIYKSLLVFFCIRGKSKNLLEEHSRKYFEFILKKDKCVNYKLINDLRDTCSQNIMLTASLDIVAENFKELGFNSIMSSKTFYKNGKFQYFIDLYGKKHKFIQQVSKYYDKIVVIEDSPEQEYAKIKNVSVIKVTKRKMF